MAGRGYVVGERGIRAHHKSIQPGGGQDLFFIDSVELRYPSEEGVCQGRKVDMRMQAPLMR